MKFSIVTISYNQKEFLQQCIDSVLSQEDVELEYLIVDPGSTDGSRELIESYGNKVIKVFEKDDGPPDGLNKGFARATGDVFGFINSDDYLLPGALASVSRFFKENGMNKFVTGSGYICTATQDIVKVKPSKLTLQTYLYGAAAVFQQGTFFPAKSFIDVGGFNANNKACWDGELFSDLLASGLTHCLLRDDLAVFRVHDDSISGSGRLINVYNDERARLFRKYYKRNFNSLDRALSLALKAKKIFTKAVNR